MKNFEAPNLKIISSIYKGFRGCLEKVRKTGEIGYSIHHNFWGQGLMSETFKTLIEFGFNNMNLHSIEANVNPQNQQSIKLLERVGFKKEAHFRENYLHNGEFKDSFIYCLLESDRRIY
jgi:ribosomal-protein-alanine N-acetyltransferase